MRATILILLAGCTLVSANPRPVPRSRDYRLYMAAEHLAITVSTQAASLSGTFSFKLRPEMHPHIMDPSAMLQIPIWFPERDSKDPGVAAFWKAFPVEQRNFELTQANRRVLDEVLGLRVSIGKRALEISGFWVLTNGAPVYHLAPDGWNQEPGLCCLIFELEFRDETMLLQEPLALCYRQPLLHTPRGEEFFYLPVLKDLAKGTDMNRYSIIITPDPSCALEVSNGEEKATVASGNCAKLVPQHHVAIRARVKSYANPQTRANGRQPFGSEANRASAAAASRRSP